MPLSYEDEKAGAGTSQKTCHYQVEQEGSGTSPGLNVYLFMKKTALLLLCGVLFMGACQKIDKHENPPKDIDLTGVSVEVGNFSNEANKLFVLNEGTLSSNNATLDLSASPKVFIFQMPSRR